MHLSMLGPGDPDPGGDLTNTWGQLLPSNPLIIPSSSHQNVT